MQNQLSDDDVDRLIEIAGGLPEGITKSQLMMAIDANVGTLSLLVMSLELEKIPNFEETLDKLEKVEKYSRNLIDELSDDYVLHPLERAAQIHGDFNGIYELEDVIEKIHHLHDWVVEVLKNKEKTVESKSKNLKKERQIKKLIRSILEIWVDIFKREIKTSVNPKTDEATGPLVRFISEYLRILKCDIILDLDKKQPELYESLTINSSIIRRICNEIKAEGRLTHSPMSKSK